MPSPPPTRLPDEIWQHILMHFRPNISDSFETHTDKVRVLRTVCLVNPAACRVARGYLLEIVTINLFSPWEMNTFLRYIYRFPEDAKLVKNVLLILGLPPTPRALPSRMTQNDLDLIRVTASQVAGRLTLRTSFGNGSELRAAQDELLEELQSDPRRPFFCKDMTWTFDNDSVHDHDWEHYARMESDGWDLHVTTLSDQLEELTFEETVILCKVDTYHAYLLALCCNLQHAET